MYMILEYKQKPREEIIKGHLPKCVCHQCHLGRKLLEHLICNNNDVRRKD